MSTTTANELRQRGPTQPGMVEKQALLQKATEKEQKEAEDRSLTDNEKFVPPNFTVKQLLDAIPAHCFHRSALHSGAYVLQDFIVLGAMTWCYFNVDGFLAKFDLPTAAYYTTRATLYTAISVIMGFFGTGLWIIAHECGHQAFSSSKAVNNAVGWVLHSILLVPYHSWRISHARHHAATGHLTRDEVFVPRTRSEVGVPAIKEEGEVEGINITEARREELKEAIGDAPIYILWNLAIQQLFGWPMYLIRNASGQKRYPWMTNHFQPSSYIFKPEQKDDIVWSDIGLVLVIASLSVWSYFRGSKEVVLLYVLPYLQVNHWLVAITFLQHTDPLLPHYSADKWTFARGALCTIDRQFMGPIGWIAMHGICETHVAHHISSKIPHYNAWEATEAIKNLVGPHYMKSEESFLISLFKNFRACRFIEDKGDVVFYKNASGIAQRVAVEESGNVSDSGVDMSADLK